MKKQISLNADSFTRSKKKLQKILNNKKLNLSLSEVSNILAQTFGFKNEYDFQKNYLSLIDKKNKNIKYNFDRSKSNSNYVNYLKLIEKNHDFFEDMKKMKGKILISGNIGIGKTCLSNFLSKLVFDSHDKNHFINISTSDILKLKTNIHIEPSNINLDKGKTMLFSENNNKFNTILTMEEAIEHNLLYLQIKNRIKKEGKDVEIIESFHNTLLSDITMCLEKYGFSFIEIEFKHKLLNKNSIKNNDAHHLFSTLNNKTDLNFYFYIDKIDNKAHIYGLNLKTGAVFNYIEFDDDI